MAQIVDHDERRRGIVDAAKRLILAGGFASATMRTIAAEAGYANGALKYYFPGGKDAIVAAAFQSMLTEIEAAATGEEADDPADELRRYLRAWFPHSADEIPTGRVLLELWEHSVSSEALTRLYAEHLSRWRDQIVDRIARARAAAAITIDPPYEPFADEYLSFTMGTVVMNLMFPGGEHLRDIDRYLDRFISALQT